MSCSASRRPAERRTAVVAALLIASTGLARTGAADALAEIEARQKQIFLQVAPSVVYITTSGGIGSGFFVSSDGLILTNRHVVRGTEVVSVVVHGGAKYQGRVVERGRDDIDLALVKIAETGTPPLVLGGASIAVGDWVASVGHGADSPWTFTVGLISNIYPHKRERPVFQTQIPLNPGSSGSPVVNRDGRVVGIVTAGIKEASSVNFAIRAEVALGALAQLGGRCQCLVVTAPKGTPVFVDGQMAGTGPRLIVPIEPGRHEVSAVVAGQLQERAVEFPAVRAVDLTRR